MKTCELIGRDLDHWAARASGWEYEKGKPAHWWDGADWHLIDDYCPSTNQGQGDAIIDRLGIEVQQAAGDGSFAGQPSPSIWVARRKGVSMGGPTRLSAAMRLHVLLKFGDDVADGVAPA